MSDINLPVKPRRISGQPVLLCLIAFLVLANGAIAYWRLQEQWKDPQLSYVNSLFGGFGIPERFPRIDEVFEKPDESGNLRFK